MPETWQSIASSKVQQRASRIPQAWRLPSSINPDQHHSLLSIPRDSGLLTALEIRITESFDATALLAGLAEGLLRSVDVVTAFCKRSAIAQQCCNCLTEIMYEDGMDRARELDEYFDRTGRPYGPLHGLPVSIKDSFKVKGYDASIGIAALCFKPAETNAAMVELLLSLGAVIYCKTNVPQTMSSLDSHNNVFGRTRNPSNPHLTAGGSSGGEGALIAMRGSILGIGTDVGGSIRIPAACNHLFGVKPSHGRTPYAGQESGSHPGSSKTAIEATAGPIATTMRDCETFMRIVCDSKPSSFDPDVISQSWTGHGALGSHHGRGVTRPLRVGIAYTDGHVTPLPSIQRFMEDVACRLSARKDEIEVVEVDMSGLGPLCLKTFNAIISIGGANNWFDLLEKTGEPLSPWLSNRLRRRPRKTLEEVQKLQAQKTELQTRFLRLWELYGGIDLIVCPTAPHPVAPIDRYNTVNYTAMFNLLDFPAGVVPVRKFSETDLHSELPKSEPLNGWDRVNRELWSKVDRRAYLGSSMNIQVVAPRLMERQLVEGMTILDRALKPMQNGQEKASKL